MVSKWSEHLRGHENYYIVFSRFLLNTIKLLLKSVWHFVYFHPPGINLSVGKGWWCVKIILKNLLGAGSKGTSSRLKRRYSIVEQISVYFFKTWKGAGGWRGNFEFSNISGRSGYCLKSDLEEKKTCCKGITFRFTQQRSTSAYKQV